MMGAASWLTRRQVAKIDIGRMRRYMTSFPLHFEARPFNLQRTVVGLYFSFLVAPSMAS